MAVTDIALAAPASIELPSTGDVDLWTEDQKALLDAAGLVKRQKNKAPEPAPRSTVVAFLSHCKRTGLDPIARQIYAIERGGKWGIQVSIDGFRLVAERSHRYAGQLPVEWTADGVTWVPVWLAEQPPAAARATVLRSDFAEPMVAVARFSSYVQLVDEWEGDYSNRRKTGRKVPGEMWARMPEVMIAKVAEALALRKAFPQELSGLYTEDEMGQALATPDAAPRAQRTPPTLEAGTRSAQRDPIPTSEPSPRAAELQGMTIVQLRTIADVDYDLSTKGSKQDLIDRILFHEGPSGDDYDVQLPTFPCARCGRPGLVEDEASICAECEVEVEAEIVSETEWDAAEKDGRA